MNIEQTRHLLTWLWSKFPNSKALADADKQATTIAYFDELWQYSLEDVIAGARKALAAQPHFVPSAPEIAHYCTKTIDYQKYLPREYAQLEKSLADVEAQLKTLNSQADLNENDCEYQSAVLECNNIRNKIWVMESQAYDAACRAYVVAQCQLAAPDLKSLGIPQPQLALEG